jgi:hypothetical protein
MCTLFIGTVENSHENTGVGEPDFKKSQICHFNVFLRIKINYACTNYLDTYSWKFWRNNKIVYRLQKNRKLNFIFFCTVKIRFLYYYLDTLSFWTGCILVHFCFKLDMHIPTYILYTWFTLFFLVFLLTFTIKSPHAPMYTKSASMANVDSR